MDANVLTSIQDYFESSARATIMLSVDDEVLFSTTLACQIIAKSKALKLEKTGITINSFVPSNRLMSGIADAKYKRKNNTVFIDDCAFKYPLRVDVSAIQPLAHEEQLNAWSVMLDFGLSEPSHFCLHSEFGSYYLLTNAELTLVELLQQGLSVAEIAEEKGITVNTVRWTLRNIYNKTRTTSQQELRQLARHFSISAYS